MAHVFLSYSREDEAEAKQIAAALEATGLEVWWDRSIPPGKTFDQVIEAALDQAAWALVLWSETSIASNWVKAEADEALRRGILVPVLIDDVRPPLAFRRIEAAELQDWDGDATNPEFANLLEVMGKDAPPPPKSSGTRASKPPAVTPQPTPERIPERVPERAPRPAGMGTGAKLAVGGGLALLVVLAIVVGMNLGGGKSSPAGRKPDAVNRPSGNGAESNSITREELNPRRELEATSTPGDDGTSSRRGQADAGRRTRTEALPSGSTQPATGSITLRYAGDAYDCTLNLQITVAGQTVVPQSQLVTMSGIPLGPADYSVQGVISCPRAGSCNAAGSGRINAVQGGLYDLNWQNTTYAHCEVRFVQSG